MALNFQWTCLVFLAVFLSFVVCIITYFKWSFKFWKKQRIAYLEPSIPWGTMGNFIKDPKSFGDVILRQYKEAKEKAHKFIGLYVFAAPVFMFLEPTLIKQVLVTDFRNFMDHGIYFNEVDDPLSAHLFSSEGSKWRKLRTKLTPTFTSGKMKMMFKIFTECGDQLKEVIDTNCVTNEPVDIKDVLARFTTNIIGSTAFGIDCNTFADPESEFRRYGKMIFSASKFHRIKTTLAFVNRDIARRLGICINSKDVRNFFMNTIRNTVEHRENNNIQRNDFMQLLINLKNDVQGNNPNDQELEHTDDGKGITFEELAAQSFVFFIAGFETSSTTMTFCLFELAINPEIQDKLRHEIRKILDIHDGVLSYEAINEMKYLGQVIEETLRKYPPLPILNRICCEDYQIPGTDTVLKQGTLVFIPTIGLHHDSEFYPNPEEFDPERFSEENKNNIHPYTYLPFGEGPRICIGLRFGILQSKVGLAVLLQNFKFSLNAKTKMPHKMDPACFIQAILGDVWLNVEKV